MTPVEWVDEVLKESLIQRASDIHIEPDRYDTVARFRVDGVMREVDRRERSFHETVISRLKVISRLNVIEKNVPQDGHLEIVLEWGGSGQTGSDQANAKIANFRISIMPTVYGEAAVLRALNRKESVLSLEELGFSEKSLTAVKRILKRPHGVVLVTGPSGSGKTTTLYSLLNTYDVKEKTVLTLEDPVEYQLLHIRQTQVAPELGMTFSVGLRAILRQDPDIVMIGEIRDEETAEIAVRASLAGRLVFSTIHTNDVIGAIVRMIDMEIGRSMIAGALTGIIAERLVRKICDKCKKEIPTPKEIAGVIGMEWPSKTIFVGQGCDKCGNTGYYGRTGIYEILEVDRGLSNLIVQRASLDIISNYIRERIVETLRQDGFEKALKGITSLEEVLRVTTY